MINTNFYFSLITNKIKKNKTYSFNLQLFQPLETDEQTSQRENDMSNHKWKIFKIQTIWCVGSTEPVLLIIFINYN